MQFVEQGAEVMGVGPPAPEPPCVHPLANLGAADRAVSAVSYQLAYLLI